MRAARVCAASMLLLAACGSTTEPRERAEPWHMAARPHQPANACAPGEERLAVSSGPDAYLYVPEAAAGRAAPFLVFLHGAGGASDRMIRHIRPVADRYGMIVLVPGSVGRTWDGIRETEGIDTTRLDEALTAAFDRCRVDRARLGVGGFSDGASYALTLGLANGDLFSHILSFAPCGISKGVRPQGTPAVFISHGRDDGVLSIDKCGRPIAASLRRAGYDVRYIEFDGKHEIPDDIGADAFSWFVGREATGARTR